MAEFSYDKELEEIAKKTSAEAVLWVREICGEILDHSRESIKIVEWILDDAHRAFLRNDPELKRRITKIGGLLGCYIGEVYNKEHGGEWGVITWGTQKYPGMRCLRSKTLFWPQGRVENRIRDGEENNVWHYYQMLENYVEDPEGKSNRRFSWD